MHTEIVLPAAELKTALTGLSKVVSKTKSQPVLQCIRIARNAEGVVTLQATDHDSFATYTLYQPDPGYPAVVLLPLDRFKAAVANAQPKDRLAVVIEGRDHYIRSFIGSIPVEEKIEAFAPEEWPPIPSAETPLFPLEPRFKTALKEALDCARRESDRYTLTGACLDVRESELHYVVGADGIQLYAANGFRFALNESVIVPNRKFLHWSGFLEDIDWRMRVLPAAPGSGAWIELSSQRWKFITKPIEGQYPSWKQVLPGGDATCLVFSNHAVEAVLATLPRLPSWNREYHPVSLIVTDEHVILRGRALPSDDWIEVPLHGVSIMGKPATVCVRRVYLEKGLLLGFRELELHSDTGPLVFRAKDRKLVICPYRCDEGNGAPPSNGAPVAEEPDPSEQETPAEGTAAEETVTTEDERQAMEASDNWIDQEQAPAESVNANGAPPSRVLDTPQMKRALTEVLGLVTEILQSIEQLETQRH